MMLAPSMLGIACIATLIYRHFRQDIPVRISANVNITAVQKGQAPIDWNMFWGEIYEIGGSRHSRRPDRQFARIVRTDTFFFIRICGNEVKAE